MSQEAAASPVPSKKCFSELFACSSLFLKYERVEMAPGDVSSAQRDGCWGWNEAELGGNKVLQDLPSPFTSHY